MGHPAVLTVADRPVQVLDDAGLVPMELTQLLKYPTSRIDLSARVKSGLVGLKTLAAESLLGHVDLVVELAPGVVLVPSGGGAQHTTHN